MLNTRNKPNGYEFDLNVQLLTCIDIYEEGREEYLKNIEFYTDNINKNLVFQNIENFAEQVLESTETILYGELIIEPPEISEQRKKYNEPLEKLLNEVKNIMINKGLNYETINKILKRFKSKDNEDEKPEERVLELRILWERLEIFLARDAIENKITRGANRILKLFDLVIHANLEGPTIDFLHRVSRCYIWGFDSECTILCRSAMDAAFQKVITDEICKKHESPKAKYGYTLAQRINIAEKENVIRIKAAKDARQVNGVATETVHNQPDITRDVFAIIKMVVSVIHKLYESN